MAIERLQSREKQDQQSEHMNKDASAGKKYDFLRSQCQRQQHEVQQQEAQLHNNLQQEVQRQSKGKELALVEEKASLNGVVIGEDGKPMEKQIILLEHYDKDNPGLAGGAGNAEELSEATKSIFTNLEALLNTADTVLNAADKVSMDPASKLVIGVLKAAMQKRKDDELNKKLAAIIGKLDALILALTMLHQCILHMLMALWKI